MNYQSVVQQNSRELDIQNELNVIKSRLKLTEEELKLEREQMANTKMKVS